MEIKDLCFIAGLDLPAVPLSEQQQKELDKQRALQQQKIKDISHS
jgi:hypothetical protein